MKQPKFIWIIFMSILILAGILRFWQIGRVPASPDWDEAALGYNAYSILHTGKDEWGQWMPVVLRSFNDYKPALYAYLIIPCIAIGGLTIEMVRFPSALCGLLTIALVFFLVKRLFKRNDIALLTMFLLAISPWHIQFSRVAFEANVGLFFNVAMVTAFVYGLQKKWLLLFVPILLAASIYTYQSEKVFAPLLILAVLIIWRKEIWQNAQKYIFICSFICILCMMPFILFAIANKGAFARAAGVSIFGDSNKIVATATTAIGADAKVGDRIGMIIDNRRIALAKTVIDNYFSHFDLNWLFIYGSNPRHRAPQMGLMYLFELPFLLFGLYALLFGKFDTKTKQLIFAWLLLAPVPASVTTGVPHEVRVLNILPTLQVFTALGLLGMYQYLQKLRPLFKRAIVGAFVCFALFNFVYYFDQYFVQQNYFTAGDWQYGYAQLVPETMHLNSAYRHVVVSNQNPMDQSYIFFLFYLKYPPQLYQKAVAEGLENGDDHAFGQYEFKFADPTVSNCDPHTLVITHHDNAPAKQKFQFMTYYPNGEPDMGFAAKNTTLCIKPTL